jgi:uncharacterized protein YwqG
MAIRMTLQKSDRVLFCGSKWFGDPDMPENMQYPTVEVTEEGETYDYPLTFICQINCEDIAPYDKEGRLPHEGMLYFFAALDEWLGYESATHNGLGEWPKGEFVVKYAKSINFETFQSCILVDDEDQPLTDPELEIVFSECDDAADGIKLLGVPFFEDVRQQYPDMLSLLQLDENEEIGLRFYDGGNLNLLMKESDLKFGNWKRGKAYLHSL